MILSSASRHPLLTPPLVAAAKSTASRFETWAYPLVVGQPLPTLPLWLTEDLAVSLDLEASYEDTCRVLRICLLAVLPASQLACRWL